jgi:hypothetical protein
MLSSDRMASRQHTLMMSTEPAKTWAVTKSTAVVSTSTARPARALMIRASAAYRGVAAR